jgi:hypothetical protein
MAAARITAQEARKRMPSRVVAGRYPGGLSRALSNG